MSNKNTSLRVGVMMGGPSGEHAVSVNSGIEVVKAVVELGHTPLPIFISQEETWHLLEVDRLLQSKTSLDPDSKSSSTFSTLGKKLSSFAEIANSDLDVVFIAMHGPYGEDGKIQAMLELLRLPYTGSGVLTSALSMDKVQFRRIMMAEHILIPQSTTFTNESIEEIMRTVKAEIGEPPFVIKPSDQGSSIGVSLVHTWNDFSKAVAAARSVSETLLVDRYVKGRELTVGVLGTKQPFAMPVTEIIPEGEFFDYNAKYLSNVTKELCPAELDTTVAQEIQQIAVQVFRIVGGAGFGRVDFILDERNQAFVLEINTIPGLTKASLLPKAAAAQGMTFTQLIQTVLDDALLRV